MFTEQVGPGPRGLSVGSPAAGGAPCCIGSRCGSPRRVSVALRGQSRGQRWREERFRFPAEEAALCGFWREEESLCLSLWGFFLSFLRWQPSHTRKHQYQARREVPGPVCRRPCLMRGAGGVPFRALSPPLSSTSKPGASVKPRGSASVCSLARRASPAAPHARAPSRHPRPTSPGRLVLLPRRF